jgi:hypothetical protein
LQREDLQADRRDESLHRVAIGGDAAPRVGTTTTTTITTTTTMMA